MWLRYGVNQDNNLVPIEDSPRGKTQLRCPYCGGKLTAKKGRIKEHHFAHDGETCREVASKNREAPNLPLYDSFNISLTGKELEHLKQLWDKYGCIDKGIYESEIKSVFIKKELLKYNDYRLRGSYEFTKLGKIPVGALSLMLFNQVQEPLIEEKLQELDKKTRVAFLDGESNFNECFSDLQIFRAELKKILSNTLYYLQIDALEETFYKIGITTRDVTERVAEVKHDLLKHFQSCSIKILFQRPHRGNVEKYFKYRYSPHNYPIGSLTEYYKFADQQEAKRALTDLRRMKKKVLSSIESDILAGKPSVVEELLEELSREERRSVAIKTGMQRAAYWGTHIGRPVGSERTSEFLTKPSSQRVVAALNEGLSLRKAAQKAGASVNTVRKVKALLEK
ncbi:GIY-YIG nuclease family protein [Calothrix sp. CCY 0018]|uniref:GIY-YIG nuclease family protein n=1 Tax=Calothrix sp. CCY 0018 TaxID=3103864 RepID=UPI0039C71A3B